MKRWMCLLLSAALLLLALGCAQKTEEEAEGYDLYFLRAEPEMGGGALQAEKAYLPELENADPEETAKGLMEALLQGPLDGALKSAVPMGTSLLSLEVSGGRALVDVSASYGSLSGVALTLADYAVTMTLTQVPEISSVKITVRGQELAYRNKQTFASRDVLLLPEEDVVGTVQAVLYFLDENGVLAPEERTLELYEGDTQVFAVARALENGPESKKLSAVLPEGFRVRSVWLEEDVCCVNLSSTMLDGLPQNTNLRPALRALAKSLLSLKTVEAVRFLRDSLPADTIGGMDVSHLVEN